MISMKSLCSFMCLHKGCNSFHGEWNSQAQARTQGVRCCQWTPLEVSSFVSKSTACALTACEHVFAIDHGRVSSHAHATFIQLSRIWLLQSAQDRVARGGELLTALSRRGQGGSFRCKTVSTASVRKGAMTRRRASTAADHNKCALCWNDRKKLSDFNFKLRKVNVYNCSLTDAVQVLHAGIIDNFNFHTHILITSDLTG